MKLGVLLPTFREHAQEALDVASEADRAGLDGVFAFDHLWPMGSPLRPALAPFPVLAAVASRCPSLYVGPLVARVGLVATAKLVEQFTTLAVLAPGRVIAALGTGVAALATLYGIGRAVDIPARQSYVTDLVGSDNLHNAVALNALVFNAARVVGRVIAALGTGDKLSEAEQVAYDLGHLSADERRQLLADAFDALAPLMSVWSGAGSTTTNQLARDHGAEINLWGVTPEAVRELSISGPVSWAGPLGEDVERTLDELESAGATWAVAAAPLKLDRLRAWRHAH